MSTKSVSYKFKGWPPEDQGVVRRDLVISVNGAERSRTAASPPQLEVPLGEFNEGETIDLSVVAVDRSGNRAKEITWSHTVTDTSAPVDDAAGEFVETEVGGQPVVVPTEEPILPEADEDETAP